MPVFSLRQWWLFLTCNGTLHGASHFITQTIEEHVFRGLDMFTALLSDITPPPFF